MMNPSALIDKSLKPPTTISRGYWNFLLEIRLLYCFSPTAGSLGSSAIVKVSAVPDKVPMGFPIG